MEKDEETSDDSANYHGGLEADRQENLIYRILKEERRHVRQRNH